MDSGYQFYASFGQSDVRSGAVTGCHARGPGPLEVMAAKMAGHIHDLANEIQVWPFQHRHGLGGELAGIDVPQGDLCRFPDTFQKVVKGCKANIQIRFRSPPFEARGCHAYRGKSTMIIFR